VGFKTRIYSINFSNAEWLSKLIFLVDMTDKFNYLDASLQAGLRSRCPKKSGVFGWSQSWILNKTRSRIFHPTLGVKLNHFLHRIPKLRILTRACWNDTTTFETFNETKNASVHHNFHWLVFATKLLTTKLHSRYV